jgi:hypothetical protein
MSDGHVLIHVSMDDIANESPAATRHMSSSCLLLTMGLHHACGEEENHFHFLIDFLVKTIEHSSLKSPNQSTKPTDKTEIMASKLTRKELLSKVYKMVPPMLEKFHKGKIKRLN